ncbi:imidazoleglycerol-phosphate dehydratase HisB [Virgibacillus sp. W0430]|uniref:imidazoleglycerol-phosphate dehydratase HisB n=1 Tax=Virgibacillus sp. W0430 TaxID=3391580 RepID=UPI003F46250E
MRTHRISRATAETSIELEFSIDGEGKATIDTGVGFFDHMLVLFSGHGLFDLTVHCDGDLEVDQHHTVEDVGIALGQAFHESIGAKEGINRYASVTIPMDEALSTVSLDISGRPCLVYNVEGLKHKVGSFDTELVEEFFQAFVNHAKITLHINVAYGKNTHHMIESIFKAFGRALDTASALNPRVKGVPSTKGLL